MAHLRKRRMRSGPKSIPVRIHRELVYITYVHILFRSYLGAFFFLASAGTYVCSVNACMPRIL